MPHDIEDSALLRAALLYSESNTRFLCEVQPDQTEAFEASLAGLPCATIGQVNDSDLLEIKTDSAADNTISASLANLKEAWQAPLRW